MHGGVRRPLQDITHRQHPRARRQLFVEEEHELRVPPSSQAASEETRKLRPRRKKRLTAYKDDLLEDGLWPLPASPGEPSRPCLNTIFGKQWSMKATSCSGPSHCTTCRDSLQSSDTFNVPKRPKRRKPTSKPASQSKAVTASANAPEVGGESSGNSCQQKQRPLKLLPPEQADSAPEAKKCCPVQSPQRPGCSTRRVSQRRIVNGSQRMAGLHPRDQRGGELSGKRDETADHPVCASSSVGGLVQTLAKKCERPCKKLGSLFRSYLK